MRKLSTVLCVLATLLFLASCQGMAGSFDYLTKNSVSNSTATAILAAVPKSITVDIPGSLLQSTGASRSFGATTVLVTPDGMKHQMGGHDFSPGMGGHYWIKAGLWDTQLRLAKAAWTLVLLDKVIVDGNLLPSSATIAGSTITWTQSMVDAYSALLPSSFAASASFKIAARMPVVGSTSRLPDFVYSLVPASDTVNSPTYAKMISMAKAGDTDLTTTSATLTLYWSEDKSKFKFTHQVEDGGASVEATFVSFDASVPAMAAGRVDAHGTMTIAIKADATAAATHGTFLTYDASLARGEADSSLAEDGSVAISSQGYADDNGGTLTDTITVTTGSSIKVYYLKEDFDGSGHLTGISYSLDGSTWTAFMTAPAFIATGYRMKAENIGMPGNGGPGSPGGMGGDIRHAMMGNVPGTRPQSPRLYDVSNTSITTIGVWIAAKDSAFTTIIGTGVVRESGKAWLSFTIPLATGDTWYLAPLGSSGTVDTAKSIQLVW